MKSIRKRRNFFALLLAISICMTVWLSVIFMAETAFFFGIISVVSFILLMKQSRLLYDATLIWNNRILSVPSAFIFKAGKKSENTTEETLVSTFGILTGNKIYRWGLNGVQGVRLNMVKIDRARMYLAFGCGDQNMQVELLHGITERQMVLDAAQKLWHETGVKANIIGW